MGASANERRDAANPWPSVYDTYTTRLPLTHPTFITPCFIVICGNFASIVNRRIGSSGWDEINRAGARGKKRKKKRRKKKMKKKEKEEKFWENRLRQAIKLLVRESSSSSKGPRTFGPSFCEPPLLPWSPLTSVSFP